MHTGRQHSRLGTRPDRFGLRRHVRNSPSLRVEIRNRIEVGTVVIDEEFITGFVVPGRPTEIHAAVVYRATDGLIQGAQLVG